MNANGVRDDFIIWNWKKERHVRKKYWNVSKNDSLLHKKITQIYLGRNRKETGRYFFSNLKMNCEIWNSRFAKIKWPKVWVCLGEKKNHEAWISHSVAPMSYVINYFNNFYSYWGTISGKCTAHLAQSSILLKIGSFLYLFIYLKEYIALFSLDKLIFIIHSFLYPSRVFIK